MKWLSDQHHEVSKATLIQAMPHGTKPLPETKLTKWFAIIRHLHELMNCQYLTRCLHGWSLLWDASLVLSIQYQLSNTYSQFKAHRWPSNSHVAVYQRQGSHIFLDTRVTKESFTKYSVLRFSNLLALKFYHWQWIYNYRPIDNNLHL